MPFTSIELSDDEMSYINSLMHNGKAHSFKALIQSLLNLHKKWTMDQWTDNIMYFCGLRHALLSERSLKIMVSNMNEEEQYTIGRKMGNTLRDNYIARFGKHLEKKDWVEALSILDDGGWGNFELKQQQTMIISKRPFLPLAMLHGYLETALDVKLKQELTSEQIGIYRLVEE